MKNPLTKTIFTALFLICSQISASAYDFCADGIFYNVTGESPATVEVTYETLSADNYSGDIVVPAYVPYNGKQYTVTRIGDCAFMRCSRLTSLILPETLVSIGAASILDCPLIEELIIPDGVTEIDEGAFSHCTSLTTMTLPEGVTTISKWLFEFCDKLESVTFSKKVYTIEQGAFHYCHSLKNIDLGNCITTISDGLFYDCTSLESITIPETVRSIGRSAFANCNSLKEIKTGSRISNISAYAFSRCSALEKFTCLTTNPPTCDISDGNNIFDQASCAQATLYVPEGSMKDYSSTYPWNLFGNIVETDPVPAPVETSIPDGLYYAGSDGRLYCIDNEGNTSTIYTEELPNTFQLMHIGDRIYGTSAGTNYTYSSTAQGDGKLFYLYNQENEGVYMNVVLDNTGGIHNRDPYGLTYHNDDIYVYDRSETVKKLKYSDTTITQDYHSWLENDWLGFYGHGYSYGAIKNDMQVTEVLDSQGNPEPVFWLAIGYNGNAIYRFKEAAISPTHNGNSSYNKVYLWGIHPTSFYIDETYGYLYFYSLKTNVGLFRIKLSDMDYTSRLELIEDAPTRLNGTYDENVGIPQLSVDDKGEYLYWCYRASEDECDPNNPLHRTGIKRIKLGAAKPAVEMVAEGADGYGVVAVNYKGNDAVSDIIAATTSEDPVEFYNLLGIRVSNPRHGEIVIRRQGNTVTKIVVP